MWAGVGRGWGGDANEGPEGPSSDGDRASVVALLGLDEDALAGALLGGLDDGIELTVGDLGHALGALGVALGRGIDLGALLDIGQPVVEQGEHVRRDLLAEPVARA